MYQYIAFGVLVVLFGIWALFKLFLHFTKRQIPGVLTPVSSTDTSSSIAITEVNDCSKNRQRVRSSNRRIYLRKEYDPTQSGISDESLKSRNSFGFVPSIRSVAPLSNRGHRGTQNFLMLLDSLDVLEDEDTKRSKLKHHTVVSGSGIEANPSDETASQTLIGKELDRSTDPGRILLNYIKIQDD